MPRLAHPWITALLVYLACACVATLVGCSPRVAGSDGAGDIDAAEEDAGDPGDAGSDGLQDAADGKEVIDLDQVVDATDNVDGSDGGDGADAVDGADGGGEADAVLPADCSSTQLPAPLTGTVEFDCKPKIYNKVVMGCGKGPPQPVKTGTPCCNCPPPYSCYCDGQCGWLRAPDLAKPQNGGQAVWTGKWVVSLAEAYKYDWQTPWTLHLQRWQPGAGKGFELVPAPKPWLPPGKPVALLWNNLVVLGTQGYDDLAGKPGFSPENPIYLYDPEANSFAPVSMPKCLKLVVAGGTLVCYEYYTEGPNLSVLDTGKLHVLDPQSLTWSPAPPPSQIAPVGWLFNVSDDIAGTADAVYLYDLVVSLKGDWADGSPGYGAGPRHLLKYTIKSQQWMDFGPVIPEAWKGIHHLAVDNVGVVAVRDTYLLEAARFRLDTLKWETSEKFDYTMPGQQDPVQTPCGLLFGSGHWGAAPMLGGWMDRPIQLTNDLKWQLLSPWGYPDEATTARKKPNYLITDKEVLILGGFNGPPDGAFVYHQDSYRLPLASLCTGGMP